MTCLGMSPGLFPIAVFIVWRLKIVPRSDHVPFHQNPNPNLRKLTGVICLFGKWKSVPVEESVLWRDCKLGDELQFSVDASFI